MSVSLSAVVSAGEAVKLSQCAQGKVEAVLPGDILQLVGGENVQLMMVQTPRMPQGSETGKPWPMAEQILAQMTSMVKSEYLTFYCTKKIRNRRGELVAMAKMPGGEWLQALVVQRGWARVSSQRDIGYEAGRLYSLEDKARQGGLGLWAYENYAIRSVDDLNNKTGRFEVVEGNVLNVATVKGITYLNFGEDWRTDFTLKMSSQVRRLFEKADIAPENYTGKHIQVRGWVSWNGGPMIDVTHPDQIRLLED